MAVGEGFGRERNEVLETLWRLIRKNHETYAILFRKQDYHNHVPNTMTSAYVLGASSEHLEEILESEGKRLIKWDDISKRSDLVVTRENWLEHVGDRDYEHAFFDFYTRELLHNEEGTDWRQVVRHYLNIPVANGSTLLLEGLFGDVLHPVINLGYAQELDNPLLAIEALTLITCAYTRDLGVLCEESEKVEALTDDPLEIFHRIRADCELDERVRDSRKWRVHHIATEFHEKITRYCGQLEINRHVTADKLLHLGALVFAATHKDNDPQYDFILLHTLTATHELIELIKAAETDSGFIPPDKSIQNQMLSRLWVSFILVYIAQGRPLIKPERIADYPIKSTSSAWEEAVTLTLTGKQRLDIHIPKVVRALLFCQNHLNDRNGFYARAALCFTRNFSENGYAKLNGHQMDVKDLDAVKEAPS